MRFAFSTAGSQLRCVEQRTPLGRRYHHVYEPERINELSTEILSVLERANRARTLSRANLANLKLVGEELGRLLIPADVLYNAVGIFYF